MIKLLQLVSISALVERSITLRDGSTKIIKFKTLEFTDGVDSIIGDTSERLTDQMETTNDAVRLKLLEGHVYNVDFNIRVTEYEKDGKKSKFMNITINRVYCYL